MNEEEYQEHLENVESDAKFEKAREIKKKKKKKQFKTFFFFKKNKLM